MIIVVKQNAGAEQLGELLRRIEDLGFGARILKGDCATVVGVVGDTSRLDAELFAAMDGVESVKRVTEPFASADRRVHPTDTVVDVSGVPVGGGHFALIGGPCAIESREQLFAAARAVKAAGADLLRGGAFKPRSSPYAFQGLGADGIRLLLEARAETGLPVVTEIVDLRDLPLFEDVDLIQVGARNMQNYELLKELGHTDRPVLLKRGPACTLRELLLAAEYLMAGGNGRVILCERGVRSFDPSTRALLDLSAVPLLHELSHLPVIVDPSHALGAARFVPPMALAAAAAGADGLLIEVHADPAKALSDGAQALRPEDFARLARQLRRLRAAAEEEA